MEERLNDLGEREIINRLKRFMPQGQVDDDTALIQTPTEELIINTDVLVEDVHFSKSTTSPLDVGWRAVATNISDLASSGVDKILGITVGLIAPPETSWRWVEEVYEGIFKALNEFGGDLLGGDCSNGMQKALSITAIGTASSLKLHRANALPGDVIVTTGPHGLSRLGLNLLISGINKIDQEIPERLIQKAIKAHQRPYPPLKALQALMKCKPKELEWRAAGTDSSDGLIEAVKSLCISSKCKGILTQSNLPRAENWPIGDPWDDWCLYGGEDFELVLSLPKTWAILLIQSFPKAKIIGKMTNGEVDVIWENGKEIKAYDDLFNHFGS